jgi:hypothetical protein
MRLLFTFRHALEGVVIRRNDGLGRVKCDCRLENLTLDPAIEPPSPTSSTDLIL